jgi:hypothetical protein
MSAVRPSLVALVVAGIAVACDRVPTAPVPTGPSYKARASLNANVKPTGLVACAQAYDSVTQVIGPKGGSLSVGAHTLFVDSLVLKSAVSVTAVAPSGTVRWVRFQPDGLLFPPNSVDGWGAVLYTSYKDCGVPTTASPRIAQVTNALGVLTYLQMSIKVRQNPWSQGNQYVVGLLPHFSNYAVAW